MEKILEKLQEISDVLTSEPGKDFANKNSRQKVENEMEINELLNYIRVCAKYLVFSNEANARERDYFRNLLERQQDL